MQTFQQMIDECGDDLNWIARRPNGTEQVDPEPWVAGNPLKDLLFNARGATAEEAVHNFLLALRDRRTNNVQ